MSKTDFDLKTIEGVVFDVDGVLSPAVIPMNSEGIPMRMANLRDGYAIQLAVKKGIKIAIITGGNDPAIVKRFNALGVNDVFMTGEKKSKVLLEWLTANGLSANLVAYVGDDIPDIGCLEIVGLPVVPADAASDVKKYARYVTSAQGGYGVARELLEQILKIRDMWPIDVNAHG